MSRGGGLSFLSNEVSTALSIGDARYCLELAKPLTAGVATIDDVHGDRHNRD